MFRLRINCFSVSADGYSAGPEQSLANPLGVGGMALHEVGLSDPNLPEDVRQRRRQHRRRRGVRRGRVREPRRLDPRPQHVRPDPRALARRRLEGLVGPNPPYHVPVFVLTHHPRAPLEMEGGTTFHFVTDGIHAALDRARDVAGGRDVRLGGGVATIREYLRAGLVDDIHPRSRRSCSAAASRCSPASTFPRSASNAPATRRRRMRCTWS
mgnify:CR=1 FL=1